MGSVPNCILFILGWVSIGAGTFAILMGVRVLFSASGGMPKFRRTDQVPDVSKLLEALSKLPQWAVMVIVGYLQILMGFWMLGATLFGKKLLP